MNRLWYDWGHGMELITLSPTLCTISDLLLHVNEKHIGLSASWLVMDGTQRLLPCTLLVPDMNLRLRLCGMLCGGKGGFGAMLRSAGKGAGSKPTTDFGACRDLHGRRLRHVNQDVALAKWHKEQEVMKEKGKSDKECIAEMTSSGINGWHLNVPGWAEGIKKSRNRMEVKRKTMLCETWVAAREKRQPPSSAPRWWGCKKQCNYAHGEEELTGAGLTAFKVQFKEKQKDAIMAARREYTNYESTSSVVSSAVQAGLARNLALRGKKRAAELSILPVQTETRMSAAENDVINPLFGEVSIDREDQTIQGVSEFGTASVYGCYVNSKKWYYEVTLLTAGVIQIGWGDKSFEGNSGTGDGVDGVGDDVHSWSYDGSRLKKWNGEAAAYGEAWGVGDVIGCYVEFDPVCSLKFFRNGSSMGVAFTNIAINGGLYPAFSVEANEKIFVNLGQSTFVYPPESSYNAILYTIIPGFVVETPAKKTVVQEIETKPASSEPVNISLQLLKDASPTSPVHCPGAKETIVQEMKATSSENPKKKQRGNPPSKIITPKELNLNPFKTVDELQLVGLDRLKSALMAAGLKCGGTLQERAVRFFSTKDKARETWDINLFAKKT